MPRRQHYSPALNRLIICALYYEARRQKKPMTVLANQYLESSLRGSESWRQAEEAMSLHESATAIPSSTIVSSRT